ncbi:universal stress protein [Photobacterium sp. WH24]|uniref:universal stress protein n=1 Tax=Photobacterium sp. WH24 TaxID=2827237 RepID=UPI001C444E55|nr:universal stress protein [Photobacterium sp. WH24]MBV7263177.1 universal stress protein [Photobacterium sp. WH24]
MRRFENLLFISDGVQDESDGLKQALSLSNNHHCNLTVLIIYPELPETLGSYQANWEQALIESTKLQIAQTTSALSLSEQSVMPVILAESSKTPSTLVIQHVLRDSYDLVLKSANFNQSETGLKAIDMELLRQCPCPVWLCRPITHAQKKVHVAVAIDAENDSREETDLDLMLLQLSRSLADSCDGSLNIISCWDFPYEEIAGNPFIHVPEQELQQSIKDAEHKHINGLKALITLSGIGGPVKEFHPKGLPQKCIPDIIESEGIELLIMGTVARSGIPGFIMGNTAEDIIQNTKCSILALKPKGFVTDVKAY